MTEKRFTINNDMNFNNKVETYELNCVRDNDNKTFYFIADSIENVQLFVKRLNELHEKNRELQRHLDVMRSGALTDDKRIKELYDENKHLQQRNKRLEEKIQRERVSFTKTHERWSKEAEDKIKELSEENERLRRCINEIYTIARLEEV